MAKKKKNPQQQPEFEETKKTSKPDSDMALMSELSELGAYHALQVIMMHTYV